MIILMITIIVLALFGLLKGIYEYNVYEFMKNKTNGPVQLKDHRKDEIITTAKELN